MLQNHRTLGFGRDFCGSSSPTLLPKQGHLQQAAEDLVQAGLEYLQRKRLHNLPGHPRHQETGHTSAHFAKQALKKTILKDSQDAVLAARGPCITALLILILVPPTLAAPAARFGERDLHCNWELMRKFPVWVSFFYALLKELL